jgi:hypothetical protein
MTTTIAPAFQTTAASSPANTAVLARGPSRRLLWAGRALTGIPLVFLTFDGVVKFLNVPGVVEASERIGYHRSTLPFLGSVELLAVLLISFWRTAPFGAVLVSAYLGGAVATHVRLGDPLFSHTLAPIYCALLIWAGLLLRDDRVRRLSPFAR